MFHYWSCNLCVVCKFMGLPPRNLDLLACQARTCPLPVKKISKFTHWGRDNMAAIFLNENVIISTRISLKFVSKTPINNIPALVQIMAWRRPGDKPLSEPMMVISLTHICVTRPQWVNLTALICPFPKAHYISIQTSLILKNIYQCEE